MSRSLVLALLIGGITGCGNGSKSAGEQQKSPATGSEEKIAVPGAKGSTEGPVAIGATGSGTPPMTGSAEPLTVTKYQAAVENKQFHLRPDEGTLTLGKAEGKAGADVTAEVRLAPGVGFHVSTDYPTKLRLMETDGVKLAKTVLIAGGAKKQGDASTFSDQALAFAVKLRPERIGSYEIRGVFTFGVCDPSSCHPRSQPITIEVAAN